MQNQSIKNSVFKAGLWLYLNAALSAFALNPVATNAPKPAAVPSPAPNAPIYEWELAMHQNGGTRWPPGNTNAPLLKLSWFLGAQAVFDCEVLANGQAARGLSTPMGDQGGGGGEILNATSLAALAETIASLPPAPRTHPPKERWLLVSGIKSNRWLTRIYDRAEVPPAVERLFEITGAHLEWALPNVNSTTNIAGAPFRSLTWRTALWNLQAQAEIKLPTAMDGNVSKPFVYASTISADGKTGVCSEQNGNYAFECRSGRILWQKPPAKAFHLAIVENDKVLVLAFENSSIEQWDLATGEKLVSLAGNPPGLEAMTASRDGRYLAVCSRNGEIRVWDLQKNGPPKILADLTSLSGLEFSPDGRYLAAAGFNYRNTFGIWDWRAGRKILTRHYWNGPRPDPATSLAWSPDGHYFAIQPGRQQVVIFDAKSWKPLATWGPAWVDGGPQLKLNFSADGKLTGQTDDGALQIVSAQAWTRFEAKNN